MSSQEDVNELKEAPVANQVEDENERSVDREVNRKGLDAKESELGLDSEVLKALSQEVKDLLLECYSLRKNCHIVNDCIVGLDSVVQKHSTTGFTGQYKWDTSGGGHPVFTLVEFPRLKALPTLSDTFVPHESLDEVRGGSALLRAPELEARYAALYEYTSLGSMRRLAGIEPPDGPDDLWPLVLESAMQLARNVGLLARHASNYKNLLRDFERLLRLVEAEGRAMAEAEAAFEVANAALKKSRELGTHFLRPVEGSPLCHFHEAGADLLRNPVCSVSTGGVGAVRAEQQMQGEDVYSWTFTLLGSSPVVPEGGAVYIGVAPEATTYSTPSSPLDIGYSAFVTLGGERFVQSGGGAPGPDDLSFLKGAKEITLQLNSKAGVLSVRSEDGGWVCVASGLPTKFIFSVSVMTPLPLTPAHLAGCAPPAKLHPQRREFLLRFPLLTPNPPPPHTP